MHEGFEAGEHIASKYRVIRTLGEGGFGWVLEVEHQWTGRRLALKILDRARIDEDEGNRRFVREARMAARLVHPNVVALVDADRDPRTGRPFLVQELLEGEDLETLLKRERVLTWERASAILFPILDALAATHAAGVIHRDVKPSNIFLSRQGGAIVPKLIDFGLSKPISDTQITQHGRTPGTPHYMSPEQLSAPAEVGPATDVWAMGVVFYEALSGRMPFDAPQVPKLVHAICCDRARPLRQVAPVSFSVGRAIDRALLRELSARHATIDAFAAALTSNEPARRETPARPISIGSPSIEGERLRFGLVATNERTDHPELSRDLLRLLGATPVVLKHPRYADLLDALKKGTVDVAWLSPVAFIHALKDKTGVGLASALRSGVSSYRGALIGHVDRAPRLDASLAGKRVAWVDEWSAAGYLAPRRLLRMRGLDPNRLFGEEVKLGSYDEIAAALRSGHVDVGPALARIDDAGEVVGHTLDHEPWAVCLGITDEIPSDVLCARRGLPKEVLDQLTRGLIGAELAPGDSVRQLMSCARFGAIDERRYAVMSFALD